MPHATQIPLQDLDSEIDLDHLDIQGKFPEWIEGTLVRNGPAKFHFGSQAISHWFDGLAMLHAFSFGRGGISYRNRFIRSTAYQNAMRNHDLRFMGFAQDPCKSVFGRLFTHYFPSLTKEVVQNANVNVARIAGKYAALTETPLPVMFDPKTLETLGPLEYGDLLARSGCFESAHPHHDSARGETVNLQIDFGKECTYTLYSVADRGEPTRKPFCSMKRERASYMHTFALTERYLVLVEFSLLIKPLDLLLKSGGYISHFHWEPERPTLFHLIERESGRVVRSYEESAFFCFHHVNAYEEGDEVVVDLISYPDASIVFGEPPQGQKRKLERFRIALTSPKIIRETIADTLLELPRIYYKRHSGNRYRFVYGVGFHYPETANDAIPLLKCDLNKGSFKVWREEGSLAGEPVFIPDPSGRSEDDGVILSVVSNALKGNSALLALDAASFEEIARVEVPHFIPYGLHGAFYE